MSRVLFIAAIVGLFMFVFSGCGSDSPLSDDGRSPVVVSLKRADISMSVERVTLTVSGDNLPPTSQDLTLTDSLLIVELEVPFGSERVFELAAYDIDETLLYYGVDTVDVVAGSITEVNIWLRPQVVMLKVSPLNQRVSIGQIDYFDVEVYNIDSLYGAAFRVYYDTALLEIAEVAVGGFLDPDHSLFVAHRESTYYAVSYVLTTESPSKGESGFGRLARFTFSTKAAGNSELRIASETASLIDWRLGPLPRGRELFLENGEVRIIEP